ncbi:MAG: prolipoprotein diacylglyceryl transferase [Bdellovibrio sp.]|nr:MAG: prolipoprotein diacylglyceryl transferase [Bdellovibrio sp.]
MSSSDVYIHNLKPFAIQFTETFGIRWYGLSYLAGFIAGGLIMYWLAKRGKTPLPKEKVADYITVLAIGTMIGGRLGYCIFYAPELFTKWTSEFPYWGVLEVHKGGMASHGGIIGVILASMYYANKLKIPKLHMLDLTVFGGSLGIFFGRIANFINGELYGRAVKSHIPWAVKFPQELYRWAAESPDKLKKLGPVIEAIGPVHLQDGRTLHPSVETWKEWVSTFPTQDRVYVYIDKIIQAVQQGNQKVIEKLAPLLTVRHPSQIYQALMEGLLVFLLLVWIWRKPRKPGVIAACFGIFYAIARIIGEQFRMPDVQIGYQIFGLTRGQILSIVMLIAVLIFFIYVEKRDAKPMGGWGDST